VDLSGIKEGLGADWAAVTELMKESLSNENLYINAINSYVLSNSGKGMRPLLCLLAAKLCAEQRMKEESTLPKAVHACAAAVEILHNGTLLHDDVADESTLRRGRKTINAIFGNAASVLSGDYWFSKAFLLVYENCTPQILELFAQAIVDLSCGELIQLDKADKLDTTFEDYCKIIKGKTASLFVTSIVGGALCSGLTHKTSCKDDNGRFAASKEAEKLKLYATALEEYALNIGYAFQMRDDIFDYTPAIDSGKPAGLDLLEHKITLPLLCAMERGGREICSVIKSIEPLPSEDNSAKISQVVEFVRANNGVELAQQRLGEFIEKGVRALDAFEESKSRRILVDFARYVGSRVV